MSPTGVRGWLLLLCALLLVWQPLNVALVASRELESIATHGWRLIGLVLVRLGVAALGIAAGLALLSRRPAAVTIAKASLLASALTDIVVYGTRFAPGNQMPGDAPVYLAGSLAYHGTWLMYLFRSRRVRQTFGV